MGLRLRAPHRTLTRGAGDLDSRRHMGLCLRHMGTSTGGAGDLNSQRHMGPRLAAPHGTSTPGATLNLRFKDTSGKNYLFLPFLLSKWYDIRPKQFFCDWSLFLKSILPSDGGDPKRPEHDAMPPFSFTCSAIKKTSTYDNDAKNSFDLLFDPGDVVGNVCIYARCWLRRERTVLNENSTPHLVAVVLKESLTDHTDQSVLVTRVQDCQWSTTVPLYQVDFVHSSWSCCLPCK